MGAKSAIEINLDPSLRNLLSSKQAWHYQVIPLSKDAHGLKLATYSVANGLQQDLELILGCEISFEIFPEDVIQASLATEYRRAEDAENRIEISAASAQSVIEDLVIEARSLGSSDLHLEVFEDMARVRIRIDGALVERHRYKASDHPGLVNRIKVQSRLDISEKRLPQDGRIRITNENSSVDVRVSILPTLHGEKVVLRILGQDTSELNIRDIGMSEPSLQSYLDAVSRPHGIVLISGPTGSGKTTTLYATLKHLNQTTQNIVTIENPVEYTLEGINQVQVNSSIGLDFASALKSFLRQDPDIIMLGEIRDSETAQMAIRAALTGHLVLSTIHTNSAWGTIGRLLDMGVPPFLLASTMNLSVAQRLVRLLCTKCRYPDPLANGQYLSRGCPSCHFTGYHGRKAIYELIPIDKAANSLILERSTDEDNAVEVLKYQKLADSAEAIVLEGLTSRSEAQPILQSQ